MAPSTQSRIVLRQRPKGAINPSLAGEEGTFRLERNVAILPDGKLGDKQVVVKVDSVSLDPAMRGWLNDTRSYIAPVALGEVMRASGVGKITALGPAVTGFAVGDWVTGTLGWQEYAVVLSKDLTKIAVNKELPASYYLGALGYPGQTAYWGLMDVAKIKAGETVVISGAAGAVGTVACQIALLNGCKVIAIAGSASKCDYLKNELHVDVALNYKDPDFVKQFKSLGYLDVYFDNVGGEILDMCLQRLKKGARIALCGAISAYNTTSPKGLQAYLNLISQRAKLEGFIVFDYASRFPESDAQFAKWIKSGELKVKEARLEGLEACPAGLVGLFAGDNLGKAIVAISPEAAKL